MRVFVEAGVWHDQESERELMDKVVQGGGDQRGKWHGDGMVSTGMALPWSWRSSGGGTVADTDAEG